MKFFIPLMIGASGVRRLPGSGSAWDDVVGSLRSGKVSGLPQILSSMLQSDTDSTWSDADMYADVISNLTENLINTIKTENSESQTQVTSDMNEWGQSVTFAETSKSRATEAEKDLISKLSDESTKASSFYTNLKEFRRKVFAVVETCTEQQLIASFDECVLDNSCTAEVLYKVVSKTDPSSTAFVTMSSQDHIDKYAAAQTACSNQKSAIENFWNEIASENSYTKVKKARDLVKSSFDDRKSSMCDTSPSCVNGKAHGFQVALSQVCAEKHVVDTLKSRVDGGNNTDSLSDRNYELQSLSLVECLLEKLNTYTNGKWDENGVSTIIDTCENEPAESVSITFSCDSAESGTEILGSGADQTCFSGSTSKRTYSEVEQSMKASAVNSDLQLVSCADTSSGLSFNIGDATGAGYIVAVVPQASFQGSVPEMSAWADFVVPSDSGCEWYCNDPDATSGSETTTADCIAHLATLTYLSCDEVVRRAYQAEAATPILDDYKLDDRSDTARVAQISGNEVTFADCNLLQ